VATSVIASIRGERDIAVGNVIGSNIFNILSVLGMASLVSPHGIQVSDAALRFDIPVMIAVAVACLPIFTDYVIARWEGLLFVGYYVAYAIYLILATLQHVALSFYSQMMVLFVVPITLLTLIIMKVYAFKKRVE
jgi:cation:H+ antiporter